MTNSDYVAILVAVVAGGLVLLTGLAASHDGLEVRRDDDVSTASSRKRLGLWITLVVLAVVVLLFFGSVYLTRTGYI